MVRAVPYKCISFRISDKTYTVYPWCLWTQNTELAVLRRFNEGEWDVDIRRALCLQLTTVWTICSNAEKIKDCAQSVTPLAATKLT